MFAKITRLTPKESLILSELEKLLSYVDIYKSDITIGHNYSISMVDEKSVTESLTYMKNVLMEKQ